MRMVRLGDQGSIVREVQGNLRFTGAAIKVDGLFGAKTDAAVRAFQKSRGMAQDGVAGPRTLSALHSLQAPKKAPAQDSFDPGRFGAWLARLPGAVYDAITPEEAGLPTRAAPTARQVAPAARPAAPTASHGKPVVSPGQNRKHRRISFPGHEGRGYVLQDFERYENYAIRLLPSVSVAPWDPKKLINNECAQLVQFFGVARTRDWRRGPQVCFLDQGEIPPGTVVATLRDGRYHNDYSGRSHVGIYLRHDPVGTKGGGVLLLDQFNKNPIKRRLKRYDGDTSAAGPIRATGRRYNWSGDGEEYFVLLA